MIFYIQLFWRLFARKETPANIPMSMALLVLLVTLYIIMDLSVIILVQGKIHTNLLISILNIILLSLFINFILKIKNFKERFLQTYLAVLGVEVVFKFITSPAKVYLLKTLFLYQSKIKDEDDPTVIANLIEPDPVFFLIAIFLVCLFIYLLIATAKILSVALETNLVKSAHYYLIFCLLKYVLVTQIVSLFINPEATLT